MDNENYQLFLLSAKSRDLINMEFTLDKSSTELPKLNLKYQGFSKQHSHTLNNAHLSYKSHTPTAGTHETQITQGESNETKPDEITPKDEIFIHPKSHKLVFKSQMSPNRYLRANLSLHHDSKTPRYISPRDSNRFPRSTELAKSRSAHNLSKAKENSRIIDPKSADATVRLKAVQRSQNNNFTDKLLQLMSNGTLNGDSSREHKQSVKINREIQPSSREKAGFESIDLSYLKLQTEPISRSISKIKNTENEPTEKEVQPRISVKARLSNAARLFSLQKILQTKPLQGQKSGRLSLDNKVDESHSKEKPTEQSFLRSESFKRLLHAQKAGRKTLDAPLLSERAYVPLTTTNDSAPAIRNSITPVSFRILKKDLIARPKATKALTHR